MGNNKKNVSVGDFENLSKKVENLVIALQVCEKKCKIFKERLDGLDQTCESLNKKAFDLNDYSIYDPNAEEESNDCNENLGVDEEILNLTNTKKQNTESIADIDHRIKSFEEEHECLKELISKNQKDTDKNSTAIIFLTEKW